MDEFVEVLPASQRTGDEWYAGTADAVYQNLDIIRTHKPEFVLVLSGDHIYKMDYGPTLAYHVANEADITVSCQEVPIAEAAGEFGVLTVNDESRVLRFDEKPAQPTSTPGNDKLTLVSMGNYIFNTQFLDEQLIADADNLASKHDFGKDIIPSIIDKHRVFAYPFRDPETNQQAFWRDVGTLDAYWEAHDSMVSGGCVISGSRVKRSMLFSDVVMHSYTTVTDSVLLPEVDVGRHCRIHKAIIDRGCRLPENMVIGEDHEQDKARGFRVTDKEIVLVTPDMLGQSLHTVR